MQRALVGVLLFALALGSALVALRARRRRDQAIMGGLALLLVLAAVGVLWWPFGGGTPAPLASSVRLYVGTHDSLVALQASTGSVVWTFPTNGDARMPAVVDGVVYFEVPDGGGTFGTVYALNARDGSRRWQTRVTGAAVAFTPAVGGGVVYVTSVKGVDALNARDGSRRWHVELDTSASNSSAPTLANDMIYFGAGWAAYATYPPRPPTAACVCIYALRASDGAVVWTYPTSDFVFDAPKVVDGVVYGSDFIDGLIALRASDGKLLWSRPDMVGTPTIVQGVIYLYGRDDRFHALSARDGSQIWQGGQIPCGAPTVSDGVIYIGGTAGMVALRASDCKLLWRSKTHFDTQHVFSTPLVSQGVIFVRVFCTYGSIFCEDQVLALKASDGSVYWSKTLVLPSDPVLELEQPSPAG